MDVSEILLGLEASLLTNAVRKDAARVEQLLADEFREFGRSGTIYSKAEILNLLATEEEVHVSLQDFACHLVTQRVALVTYRSERTAPGGEPIAALRSSLWVFRENRWQMVFHQGTRLNAREKV